MCLKKGRVWAKTRAVYFTRHLHRGKIDSWALQWNIVARHFQQTNVAFDRRGTYWRAASPGNPWLLYWITNAIGWFGFLMYFYVFRIRFEGWIGKQHLEWDYCYFVCLWREQKSNLNLVLYLQLFSEYCCWKWKRIQLICQFQIVFALFYWCVFQFQNQEKRASEDTWHPALPDKGAPGCSLSALRALTFFGRKPLEQVGL